MEHAIPYRTPHHTSAAVVGGSSTETGGSIREVITDHKSLRKRVAENAVVVFARKGCCMCHVVKLLLHGHGVSPIFLDVEEQNEDDVTNELFNIIGVGGSEAAGGMQFPAVFVGGKLFGGLEDIMAAHISGELVPKLREARALWL